MGARRAEGTGSLTRGGSSKAPGPPRRTSKAPGRLHAKDRVTPTHRNHPHDPAASAPGRATAALFSGPYIYSLPIYWGGRVAELWRFGGLIAEL